MDKLKKIVVTIKSILKLPKVTIRFYGASETMLKNYQNTYTLFTKLHRLKLFRNKAIGVALIELDLYDTFEKYYKSINGKNSAAYYARKAIKRGYSFVKIDRNNHIEDMYEINTSSIERQGKAMSSGYLQKQSTYKNDDNYLYFGVVNDENKLLAYCNIGFYGDFSLVSTLLGHKNYLNDGVMYLMMVELNKLMFEKYKKQGYKYIMYDTFFGASKGLQQFKNKLGYKAYKVKWLWKN